MQLLAPVEVDVGSGVAALADPGGGIRESDTVLLVLLRQSLRLRRKLETSCRI